MGGRTGPYQAAAFDLTPCSDLPSLDAVGDVSQALAILDAYLIRVGDNRTCLWDPNFRGLCNPPLAAATAYRWVPGAQEESGVRAERERPSLPRVWVWGPPDLRVSGFSGSHSAELGAQETPLCLPLWGPGPEMLNFGTRGLGFTVRSTNYRPSQPRAEGRELWSGVSLNPSLHPRGGVLACADLGLHPHQLLWRHLGWGLQGFRACLGATVSSTCGPHPRYCLRPWGTRVLCPLPQPRTSEGFLWEYLSLLHDLHDPSGSASGFLCLRGKGWTHSPTHTSRQGHGVHQNSRGGQILVWLFRLTLWPRLKRPRLKTTGFRHHSPQAIRHF